MAVSESNHELQGGASFIVNKRTNPEGTKIFVAKPLFVLDSQEGSTNY